jgi:hypothetical protein
MDNANAKTLFVVLAVLLLGAASTGPLHCHGSGPLVLHPDAGVSGTSSTWEMPPTDCLPCSKVPPKCTCR